MKQQTNMKILLKTKKLEISNQTKSNIAVINHQSTRASSTVLPKEDNSCGDDSAITLTCSNKMADTITIEEFENNIHPKNKLFNHFKPQLAISSFKLRTKEHQRKSSNTELEFKDDNDENDYPGRNVDTTDLKIPRTRNDPTKFSVIVENENKNTSTVKKLFKKKSKAKALDIGVRLALPDKIGVMCGLETPRPCSPDDNRTPYKDSDSMLNDIFQTSEKNLMVLNDQSRVFKSITFSSPFQKVEKRKKSQKSPVSNKNQAQETSLRTSELHPSKHQITIPFSTEFLIHARVCALLEGYDELLQKRAKAGKRWFSFGDLVGINRADLQNMYLRAIGQKPEIPQFVGEHANQPPPLPQGPLALQNFSTGNPFERNLSTLTISSESTSSYKRRGQKIGPKASKPHPATIKCLLECADDIVVEAYFTETIGYDTELIEGKEATSVQVAIFSSYRQRQFIVCFRGSMMQHAKPIKFKGGLNTDADGGKSIKYMPLHPQSNFLIVFIILILFVAISLLQ